MSRIPDSVVMEVLDRSDRYCEIGGLPLGHDCVLHHRKNRGKGGKGNLDYAENIIAVHAFCHMSIHAFPDRSYVLGWLVHTGDDPSEIDVQLLPGICRIR